MSRYTANIITKSPATPTGPTTTGRAPGIWRMDDVAYWTRQGLWPNPSIQAPDTYFPYVSLLLSTTSLGNANNSLFVDSSGAFNPVSRNGNTTQGSFTPYSTNWSNSFVRSPSSYLTVPNPASQFAFGTGDFTVEAWVYLNTMPSGNGYDASYWIVGGGPVNSNTGFDIAIGSTNLQVGLSSFASLNINTAHNMVVGTWYHVAVVRSGSTLYAFINGAQLTSVSVSGVTADPCLTGLAISAAEPTGATSGNFNGYISNLRIVKGTAVYTSAFTPPTSALTAISGTSLLTCQSNRFRDASSNNFTITANGNTSVQDFGPFNPAYPGAVYNQSDITNWSGYFQNTVSGNHLRWSFPGSPVQNAVAGTNYTLEFWVYRLPKTNTYQCMFSTENDRNNIILDPSGNVVVTSNGGTVLFSGFSANTYIPLYVWTHVALVCSGTTWTLYFNGVSYGTYSGASKTNYATGVAQLGARNDMDGCGYMSNFRVSTVARYSGNFTPSTTPFANDANTAMLTLQSAAFADNSSNAQALEIRSSGGFSPTVTGNSPFNTVGYWSNYFDGNSYLTIPNNTALNVWDNGSGSFTVEAWIYATASIPNNTSIIAKATNDGNPGWANGWAFQVFNGYLNVNTPGDNRLFNSNTTSVPLNQWVHCALVKSGSTVSIYQNGTRVGTTTNSNTYSNTTDAVAIGVDRNLSGGGKLTGYVSNARMVKGTAVYDPTQSTLTVPTTPLTAITNTSLLTCQNGRFIDNSTNAFTITLSGSPQTQSFDPFYTSTIASNGGSMYFDGGGDYLQTISSPSFAFGTSDYTLECWVYATSTPSDMGIYEGRSTGAASDGFTLTAFSANVIRIFSGGVLVASSGTNYIGTWAHVAVTRASGTTTLWINGVSQGTSSSSYNCTNADAVIGGGRYTSGSSVNTYFPGYIANFRIVKGTALYTSTFTPPTAPVTPTAATTLLVNGMNAGVFDATTINDMETVGNTQVRYPSPFAPTNYWAGAFDGAGDYLTVPYSTALQLPGDFTIEAWVYLNSRVTSFPCIVANYSTYTVNGGFALFAGHSFNTTKYTVSFNGSFPVLTSSSSIVYGAWTHVAVVRSGSTLTLYINGVSEATATSSATVTGTGDNWWIATSGDSTTSSYINGSVSNLRIVKGTAVYTGNFTPSTTPLTAISGTALLTCQNKTFIDNSSNAIAITSYGNATAGAIGPFTATGGTSTYFDGSGDNLFMPSSPSMNCGTGNWTVEGWVCTLTRTTNYPLIFGNNRGGFTTDALAITASNSDSASFNDKFVVAWGSGGWSSPSAGNSALLVSNVTNSNGVWYHLAVVRNGTSVKMYRNGIEAASATVSSGATFNWGFNGSLAGGGNWDGAQGNWNGYLDDLRITNGVARYTSNFTPPTQAFPTY